MSSELSKLNIILFISPGITKISSYYRLQNLQVGKIPGIVNYYYCLVSHGVFRDNLKIIKN